MELASTEQPLFMAKKHMTFIENFLFSNLKVFSLKVTVEL